jgi:hypothetical protein
MCTWDNCKCLLSKILSDLCIPDICYSNHFQTVMATCYYSVQNVLSSHWLAKNSKIKINWTVCITVILPVVLNTCETWSLTLSEGHQLRVFQNRVWAQERGTKGKTGENNKIRSFMIFTPHQIPFWWSNQGGRDGWGTQHAWEGIETYTEFQGGKLKVHDELEDLDGCII